MEYKDRIKAARKHARLTQERLAERIGIKQASISDLETGKSASSTYNATIAEACRVSAYWLETGKGDMLPTTAPNKIDEEKSGYLSTPTHLRRSVDQRTTVEAGPDIETPFRAVKILGTAQMGSEGYWYALDEADGYVDVPSRDPGAYALRLKGDSMAPAIKHGWVAVCEPNSRLVPFEYVFIRLLDGESMVKELLSATDEEVVVESVNRAYPRRTIPMSQVEVIHYVGTICPPSKIRL